MSRQPFRLAILDAARVLEEAGVPNARVDAEILAAHTVGVERPRLGLIPLVDQEVLDAYGALIAERAKRVPLQHLIGEASMGDITVGIGKGVFIPRPETELLFGWALAYLEGSYNRDEPPVVLDLCTGSGILALAIANARPDAVVHAVELDPQALSWARKNADAQESAGDTPINLRQGDVTDRNLLEELEGKVDLIVSNPPYVPDATEVDVEVRDHDPTIAVFGGPDGLDVIRPLVSNAARLLRIGGAVGIEHDDTNGTATADMFRARRVFGEVAEHPDLAGRPRFVVARRVATATEAQWL